MHKVSRRGLSFLELMIAVLLLALVFLYVVPIFLTSSRYTYQQEGSLRASLFAQAVLERIRQNAQSYQTALYQNLYVVYDPSRPYQYSAFFQGTMFDPGKSYIVAYNEGDDPVGTVTGSKKVVVHLEWNVPPGEGGPTRGNYTLAANVARPPDWFPLNPQVLTSTSTSVPTTAATTLPTTVATTVATTVGTTIPTTFPTTSFSTTSTSSIRTTSTSTIRTTTTSTSSISTTSVSTTSTSSIPTTSVSTTSTSTVPTTSTSTTSTTSFPHL